MRRARYSALLLALLVVGAREGRAQAIEACTLDVVLRGDGTACPDDSSNCTAKGSTLTWTELDGSLVNLAGLCSEREVGMFLGAPLLGGRPQWRAIDASDLPAELASDITGNAATATSATSAATAADLACTNCIGGTEIDESSLSLSADHGALSGLSDDDHAQYTLLAGRGSSQTINGAVGTTGYLRLNAHTGDGVGTIYLGNSANPDTGETRIVYGNSGIYSGLMYASGKATYFLTCAGVGGGAGVIGCTSESDHWVQSRGFVMVGTDGTFPGVALRGYNSSSTGISNQFVGLQLDSGARIGWANAANLTFSPTADLLLDRDAAGRLRVQNTIRLVPTDTAPTCDTKGIQWERSAVDALCRCNGSTWDKLAGAGSCP